MSALVYRVAGASDVPAMAAVRAAAWGTQNYWETRISGYMARELNPQHALLPRVLYVAHAGDALVGLIAGHLTRRYACDGELEWIDVLRTHRRTGIASRLLQMLATWFAEQNARRICVDVEPANTSARRFYELHGATDLNPHWMVWSDIRAVFTR